MNHTYTHTHNLAWSLELNNVLWPQVPVQDSTGEIRPHDTAFLLPHEVLAIVAGVQLNGAQRIKSAGKEMLIQGATIERKGDWKWYSEILGWPRWNNNAGICWRCNIKLEDLHDVGLKAAWREQRNKLSHADLLARLATNQKLSPMSSCPGFTSAMVKLDWMHILDQGVCQYFLGSILYFLVRLARYGQNKEIKCSQVWRLILDFYQEKGVKDKLKHLRPVQPRSELWSSPETMAMKVAMHSLHLCYEMLSSKLSDEQRQQTLLTESTKFASQLVLLHNKEEDRWACTAKVHLFLELAMEKCSPALTWN